MVNNRKRMLIALRLNAKLSEFSIKTSDHLLSVLSELSDRNEQWLDTVDCLLLRDQEFGVV